VEGSESVEYEIGRLRYFFRVRDGFLQIRYFGEVDSVETAAKWLEHIEQTLREHGRSRVLWDSRPALPLPNDVRTHIWEWFGSSEVLRASAIVVESELLRISANLSVTGSTLVLRAFGDEDEATAWLRAGGGS